MERTVCSLYTRARSRPLSVCGTMERWTRRISTAVVRGNARRALNTFSALAFRFSFGLLGRM